MKLLPSLVGSSASVPGLEAGVGLQRRQMEQAGIGEDVARFQAEDTTPAQRLAQYWNIVGQPLGQEGQSYTNQKSQDSGSLLNGLLGIGGMALGAPWGEIGSSISGLFGGGAAAAVPSAFTFSGGNPYIPGGLFKGY